MQPASGRSLRQRTGTPRGGRPHIVLQLLATLLLTIASVASAHATVVLGTLRLLPDPPASNQAVVLSIYLEDPTLTPVEDAVVFIDLTPADGGETTTLRLDELADQEATYQAEWSPPEAGEYEVAIRDRTFRQEEAVAHLGLHVGADLDANGELAFLLPPTPIGPRSMTTWLGWLIGLPVLVGVIVTVLVLRTAPKEEETGTEA